MKAIRWRKDRATVDGVKILRARWHSRHTLHADLGGSSVVIGTPSLNKQQIDAAAYALADLVATLKGME